MKIKYNKRIVMLIVATLASVALLSIIFLGSKEDNSVDNKIDTVQEKVINEESKLCDFLKSIAGIKAESVELISNPIGLKGKFIVPDESALNGINHYLKSTQNNKISNLKLDICNGYIFVKLDYIITLNLNSKNPNTFTTPIEIKIVPTINKNKDLDITLTDVKFLNIKVSSLIINFILDSFIDDLFPSDSGINVVFNDGVITIGKDAFNGIDIKDITINKSKLKVDMLIKLENI